jgi:S-formylglutathione hydrolase FrmB
MPRMIFSCGTKDFVMYRHFLVFRDYAEKLGLDAEFREVEGYNHEWRFWELEIQRVMDVFLPSDKRAGNAF